MIILSVYSYQSQAKHSPSLLGCKPPKQGFEMNDIRKCEIVTVVMAARLQSSPSPFDQVPYVVFKRCPSLDSTLLDLFNICWSIATIPESWKLVAIKLMGKSVGQSDTSQPSNIRPIALTSCWEALYFHP